MLLVKLIGVNNAKCVMKKYISVMLKFFSKLSSLNVCFAYKNI